MLPIILESLLKIALIIAALMTAAAYLVLVERRLAAWVQDRIGPNRVGIPLTKIRLFGLGQPLADGVKFFFKAEFTPTHVNKALYFLAPVVMFVTAIAVFAVIPCGSVLPPNLLPANWGVRQPIALLVAPGLDVGVVYIYALGSIAVYGVVLGGWASNNKFSFLGGLRSSAQLIGYEIPLGLGFLGVVMACGSLRLDAIIRQQASSGLWNAFTQPLGLMVFGVAAFAEAARLPFDLPEAEQELVGGYHTEYFGVKLLLYLVAEYVHMIAAALLIAVLFLGGWHFWGLTGAGETIPWTTALLRVAVLLGKTLAVIFFFMLARWSWPRFRFDQLMTLAWLVMLPLGLINVVAVACWMEYGPRLANHFHIAWQMAAVAFGWSVLAVAWLIATASIPSAADNRPRRGPIAPSYKDEEIPRG